MMVFAPAIGFRVVIDDDFAIPPVELHVGVHPFL